MLLHVQRPPQRSAVTAFAAEPTSATAARRFVRQTLNSAGMEQTICDRAELIVSELVTNAVLHAGTGPIVSVRIDDTNVRIEVEDTSPAAPVLREYGLDASTGRGLRVVSTAASEWGVETTSSGKAVWATLFTSTTTDSTAAPSMSAPHLTHKAGNVESPNALDALNDEPTFRASFENIPVQLYGQLESHNESLVREFSLLAIQVNGDDRHHIPELLRDAVVMSTTMDVRFTMLRIGARAASRDAEPFFSMDLQLTKAAVRKLERYARWSAMADELSDQRLLLTASPGPDVKALRRWLVEQTVRQVERGEPASPWSAARVE
jgi:anti-sigma regulatory factor (Ser/Thr protein kinase)